MVAMGHSRRFVRFRATSAHPPELTTPARDAISDPGTVIIGTNVVVGPGRDVRVFTRRGFFRRAVRGKRGAYS
jgi:hypothetical protein